MQPRFKTNWFGTFLLVIPLLGLFLLAADLTIPLDASAFLKGSLWYSATGFFIFWILSTFRSRVSGTYVMVGLFFLVLWIVAGIPTVAYVNQRFDASTAETYAAPVVRKFTTSGTWTGPVGGARTHSPASRFAVVPSWKSDGEETIPVSAALYVKIEPQKSSIAITLRRGRLNLPWLEGVRLLDR